MKTRGGPTRRQRVREERLQFARPPSAEGREHVRNRETALLLDVIDRALDRGLVLDAWAHVPVAGLDVLTIDARLFVASCEQYLRYADAVAQHPPVALPASPPAESAHVIDAPQLEPAEDDASQLGPGAAPDAQAGGDAARTA